MHRLQLRFEIVRSQTQSVRSVPVRNREHHRNPKHDAKECRSNDVWFHTRFRFHNNVHCVYECLFVVCIDCEELHAEICNLSRRALNEPVVGINQKAFTAFKRKPYLTRIIVRPACVGDVNRFESVGIANDVCCSDVGISVVCIRKGPSPNRLLSSITFNCKLLFFHNIESKVFSRLNLVVVVNGSKRKRWFSGCQKSPGDYTS